MLGTSYEVWLFCHQSYWWQISDKSWILHLFLDRKGKDCQNVTLDVNFTLNSKYDKKLIVYPPNCYDREQNQRLIKFSLCFCASRCTFFIYLRSWDNRNATHSHQVDVHDYQHDQDDNIYQSNCEKTSEKLCLWHEIGLQICRPLIFKREWQTNGLQGCIDASNLPSLGWIEW